MRLLHYSAAPFVFDPARKYEESNYGFKPVGLWLSVEGDDDWRVWCEGENFNPEALEYVSEITLKPDANVLLIDTVQALDAFDSRYAKKDRSLRNIDWPAVKAAYDGLIIAPYHWSRRLDMLWYYGWDCASGVIWNLRAIEKVDSSSTCVPPKGKQ